MKFSQYQTDSGKFLVYIDPEDIKLPIPDEINSNGTMISLDTGDKKDIYFENAYKPLLLFNAETYDTLKKHDISSWDVVFGSVNRFLKVLDDNSKLQICMVFMKMHANLNEMTSGNILTIIQNIGSMLDELDHGTDLCTKLEDFVNKDMPIPNLEDVGSRPQDTEEMTFRRPHVLQLTTIALLCKLLSPIFGQFFWQYKRNTNVDNNIKEIHCATILTPLFNRRYRPLILKLNYFVGNILVQQYKQKDDIISAYSGNTIDSQALSGVSSIYTRKFITVDLYKTDGNLMTYITTCLKNSVDTQYKTASSKNSIKERDSNLKETASDEGNASRLENESFSSNKTADVPIIVEWEIEIAVKKWKKKFNIDEDIYDQAVAYYSNNLPAMTCISNYMLCTYFGTSLGGAQGISMISAQSYMHLSIILQYILIQQKFYSLVYAMSVAPINRVKAQLTSIDNKVRMTWCNTYSYRNFKERFPFGIGDKECDAKLKDIVEYITGKVLIYNIAPIFYELMGAENINGREYQCTPDVMEKLCDFVNSVTASEEYL